MVGFKPFTNLGGGISPTRTAVVLNALIFVIVISAIAGHLISERSRILKNSENVAAALIGKHAQSVQDQLVQLDLTLRELDSEIKVRELLDGVAGAGGAVKANVLDVLVSYQNIISKSLGIHYLDKSGITISSQPFMKSEIQGGGACPTFQFFAPRSRTRLVGVLNTKPGTNCIETGTLYYTRVIKDRNEDVTGVLIALLPPESFIGSFEDELKTLTPLAEFRIVAGDSVLVASEGANITPIWKVPTVATRDAPVAEATVSLETLYDEQTLETYTLASKKIPGFQVVIQVAYPESSILAIEWYSNVLYWGIAASAFLIGWAILSFVIVSLMRKHQRFIRASERRFDQSTDYGQIGVWDWNIQSGDLYWSKHVWSMLGYEEGEIESTHDNFIRCIHPDDRNSVLAAIRNSLQTGKPYTVEHRVVWRDGTNRWIVEKGDINRDSDGTPIQMLGVAIDVTEQKMAEEALRESEARLKQAVDNQTRLIDGANAPIIALNRRFQILEWNATTARITGLDKAQVSYRNFINEFVSEETADLVRARFEEALAGINTQSFEFSLRKKDGECSDIMFSATPYFDMHGDIVGIIGVGQEITAQKQAEAALRQAQKLDSIGQLTGGVAHDFNNLMQIIGGNSEMLMISGNLDEGDLKEFNAISDAIKRGSSLTQRLLAFSRKQTLLPKSTDIGGLVTDIEDMLRRTLGETIDLKVTIADDLGLAMVDGSQLDHALVNLAVNARDAMPEGGNLTIDVVNATLGEGDVTGYENVVPGSYIKLTVSDTGCGMPPEILEKVYEPFFTTKDVGKGSGLGLSTVYGLIKQSEGHITIDSEVGRGTRINLYLPIAEKDVEVPVSEVRQGLQSARGSGKILVVEDDPHVRKIPAAVLRAQGYDVSEAENGREAIEQLESDDGFDLLFTDVVLPGGISGPEIAKRAKQIQPDIKILYTSGYTDHSASNTTRMDAESILLNKPYRSVDLLQQVRILLDGEGSAGAENP